MSQRRSEEKHHRHRPAPAAPPPVLDEELVAELAGVAEGVGCELIHAELAGRTLRLFIDRPEGVGLADCERVSRQASALLDVLDFGTGRYLLEVSSPGLDRQLYGPRDYERFAGHRVRVSFRSPESGEKRTVVGRLAEFEAEGDGQVRVELPEGEEPLRLTLGDILAARLEIEL